MTEGRDRLAGGPSPRVLVTGIGLETALGRRREPSWRSLRQGAQGFVRLDLKTGRDGGARWSGAPIASHSLVEAIEGVLDEAVSDAGLARGGLDPDRTAVVFGLSKGDVASLATAHRSLTGRGPRRDTPPRNWTRYWPGGGASRIARLLSARGPCLGPVAACATGLVAALEAAALIRRGLVDVAFAGAADRSLHPLVLGAFDRMGVMPRLGPTDDPGRCVRPWDRARSGFLVGEGAALLVLERDDHARARGALPYCELAGGARGSDAFHITDLDPNPANLAGLIGRALAFSDVDASDVDHVNVHGTATRVNDPLECQALRLALGDWAERVACSANKAQIGHGLGAAGAVELAFTCLAVRDGFVPPTRNLDEPDPLCDLDGTPHTGRQVPVRTALKLSLGFGGHLVAAVLRQAEAPRREAVGP